MVSSSSSSSSPPPPPPPPPPAATAGQQQPTQASPTTSTVQPTNAPKFDTSSIDLEQLRQVLSLRDPELLKHVETYIRLKHMLDRQARIIESALTGQQQQQQVGRFSVMDTASSTPTALSVRPSTERDGGMVLVEEPADLQHYHHHHNQHHHQQQMATQSVLMAINGTNITGGMEPLDLEALLNNKEEETRTTLMMKKIPK